MKPITRHDVFWGYAAQALNIGAGLILLPVILRLMSVEEVGLWFVFLTLGSIAQLLEAGFQPTIARNAAYVYSGANELLATGLQGQQAGGPLNRELLADLVAASRRTYMMIALAALFILSLGGTAYIQTLLPPHLARGEILLGWLAFATGCVVNSYFGFYNGLLQGRGDVTDANKVVVISRGMLVVAGSALVALGWGLLGLGIASLASAAGSRLYAHHYFFSERQEVTDYLRGHRGNAQKLIRKLWHNAVRMGLVGLGGLLIVRANILVASTLLGLEVAASYGLSLQLMLVLSAMSIMITNLHLPRMNTLQLQGRVDELRSVFGLVVLVSWALFIVGASLIITFGGPTLRLIGSDTALLETIAMTCLALISLLEMNHGISGAYLTTLNHVPFVRAALWSGVCILGMSLVLVTQTDLGVWGLIIPQGVVQAMYNNWKWPKDALANLGCGFAELLNCGMLETRRLIRGKLG